MASLCHPHGPTPHHDLVASDVWQCVAGPSYNDSPPSLTARLQREPKTQISQKTADFRRLTPSPRNSSAGNQTAKSTHHPHKIDDQHRECKTAGGAYFAFFFWFRQFTTPPKIPTDEEGLLWGWWVVGGPLKETAENRRLSQKTEDFRRKPRETADCWLRHLRSVTFSSALIALGQSGCFLLGCSFGAPLHPCACRGATELFRPMPGLY